ncbi:TonB-dependent receptor [Chitinophaga nivalis]|uniref:TonB-dependent receptor n=1 Tax=Chitinophaga nivalis TaxID=2991709 RepID=A0ABT3INE3_9BACT|nr:TonB-dependent receptor [Chitinophaga nivalis]MCW3464888.1 TonB-dependent receptor [Chitinophaga nivalis]MCW3485421.1 TonB-dependent receptor [Chitinophaga nivalis]
MKLTVALLIAATLQVSARTYAQGITLREKQTPIPVIFKKIWTQTGYDFVYDQALLNTTRPVDINLQNATLEEALTACFANQELTYTVKDKIVLVKQRAATHPGTSQASREVRGKVTDEQGTPLPGASIKVKGSNQATTTNNTGDFVLPDVAPDAVLVISFVGYLPREINAAGNLGVIRLQINNAKLDEIVVIAYGTQKKQSVVGAIAAVTGEQLAKQQVVSVTQGLQGLAAGVTVVNSSGQPGSAPEIRIRGIGSINASSSPLLVVDGIPYDGNINTINPNDVESMNVLKDASAAALYGSRAANGVILISTRKGRGGKDPAITVYGSYGLSSRATKEYAFVSSEDYMKLAWEAQKNYAISQNIANPGKYASDNLITGVNTFGLKYNPYNVANPIDENGNLKSGATLLWDTDWEKEIRNPAIRRKNVGVNVSGGSDKYKYYISADYLDQDGVVRNSNYKRITTRFNGDAYLKKWLKVGVNTTIASSNENNPTQSGPTYNNAVQFPRLVSSIYPLYRRNDAGEIVLDNKQQPIYDFGYPVPGNTINHSRPVSAAGNMNVVSLLQRDKTTGQGLQTSLNAYGEITFTDYLKFKSNIGVDRFNTNTLLYANPTVGDAVPVGGRVRKDANFTSSWTWNNMLSFQKTFGLHNIGAMASAEAYDLNIKTTAVGNTGFPVSGLEEVSAGASKETSESATSRNRIESYLGRITYSYNDKYFFEGTLRTDGSTRWSNKKRWGVFYAVGGSWVLSNEDFMKHQSVFDLVKLRASYGELGNQALPEYFPYITAYGTGYNDLSYPGIYNSLLGNPNLSWEKLGTYNIGVDLSFANNRIDLSLEYYNKNTFDLIFTRPFPTSTGITGITDNIGKLRNSGIEITINSRNMVKGDFKWSTSFNLTTLKNRITALPQAAIISGNKRLEVGNSYAAFWIYEWAGVNPDNGKPQWYADDPKNPGGTVIVNQLAAIPASGSNPGSPAARRSYQGSALPTITGGLSNSFSYKQFDLSFLLNYAFGGKILDADYIRLMHGFSRLGSSLSTDILDRWQKPGDVTDVPKLGFGQNDWENASTRNLFSGDYIRLRNITLGYTLPAHVTGYTNQVIKSCRIFLQADNIFTWSRTKKGTDPEQNIDGTTRNSSSVFKTFSVGVNVGL